MLLQEHIIAHLTPIRDDELSKFASEPFRICEIFSANLRQRRRKNVI